ncbi:MAG: VTT domain-containing protein [Candidatus Harrisonbacteria bacterium]|nr:VTT domain-containing protein [Candidatus Harrisonbacteria bacterium]
MKSFFLASILALGPWRYLLLMLVMAVEGDATLFATGFLTEQGYFSILPAFVFALIGTLLGDILWYWMGTQFQNSSNRFVVFLNKISAPFDHQLSRHTAQTILASKFSIAIHRAMIFRVGAIKEISFRAFLRANVIASTLWILSFGTLGYISGASFALVRQYVQYLELGLLMGLVLFALFSYAMHKSIGFERKKAE